MTSHSYATLDHELCDPVRTKLQLVAERSVDNAQAGHPTDSSWDRNDEWDQCNLPQKTSSGFMHRTSPMTLHVPIANEMSFIEWYPKGDAVLTFHDSNGEFRSISNLNLFIINERCPLLAMAFEPSGSASHLHLETLTSATARPFLRYLYTGTYAPSGPYGSRYEDVPTSILFHCQLYRLGSIYELAELKSLAYVNILRQCEFGCSSPDKPIDLCAAIQFAYQHLRKEENLIDAIINYCVSCFLSHRLAEDEEFKQLAFELRPFHQDLCRNSRSRAFENETASAIIQMPFRPYIPETYASREDPRSQMLDYVHPAHSADDEESQSKKRKRMGGQLARLNLAQTSTPPTKSDKNGHVGARALTELELVLRQRRDDSTRHEVITDDPASGDEDLRIVRKRRVSAVDEAVGVAPESSSDSDFEVVPAPARMQGYNWDNAESDRDSGAPVEGDNVRDLPVRLSGSAVRAGAAETDSESEWTLV